MELVTTDELLVFTPKTSLTIISRKRVVAVSYDQIHSIVRAPNGCIIYTEKETFPTRVSLQELLMDTPVNSFIRIARNTVVNICHLELTSGGNVIVNGNKYILQARFRDAVIQQLSNYLNHHIAFFEP